MTLLRNRAYFFEKDFQLERANGAEYSPKNLNQLTVPAKKCVDACKRKKREHFMLCSCKEAQFTTACSHVNDSKNLKKDHQLY